MSSLFIKMSRFPTPHRVLKVSKENEFIKKKGGFTEPLIIFIKKPSPTSMDSTQIVLNMLAKPFKQFAWLLTRIVGQGSIEHVPNMLFAFFIIQLNQAVVFK